MSVNSSSSIIRFGTFELELQTGELRHAGQKVKLQEQPFQVLAALLEYPGKIVTREELRSKLWPEDTFVDFDHSLNAAIKRLRDALRNLLAWSWTNPGRPPELHTPAETPLRDTRFACHRTGPFPTKEQ
jgi:DNA-binding response OmpR family regulator